MMLLPPASDQLVVVGSSPQVLETGRGVAGGIAAPDARFVDAVERDRDGRRGMLIAQRVVARTTLENIDALAAFDQVIACAAVDHVVDLVAGQDVVEFRTRDILKALDVVVLHIASRQRSEHQFRSGRSRQR